jgi:hypothetical protein
MRWTGHIARMGEMNAFNMLVGKPERQNYLEVLDLDEG